jgi:hypothetical protein
MFERYITIKEKMIICGQNNSGLWYCKELPADTTAELKVLIGEINGILNEYNNKTKKEEKK